MNKRKQGSSINELMVVLAILAVISAYIIPTYREFKVQAVLSESTSIFDNLKAKIMKVYYKAGVFPNVITDIGMTINDYDSDTIQSVALCNNCNTDFGTGAFYIYIDFTETVVPGLSSPRLVLLATVNSGSVQWNCYTPATGHAQSIPFKYLPGTCEVYS